MILYVKNINNNMLFYIQHVFYIKKNMFYIFKNKLNSNMHCCFIYKTLITICSVLISSYLPIFATFRKSLATGTYAHMLICLKDSKPD